MKKKFLLFSWLVVSPALITHASEGSAQSSYQLYLKALLLESQGNFVAAQEQLNQAIALAPESAYLRRTAAELALRLGQVNQGLIEAEKATQLDQKDVKALILAGQIHWALGHSEDAERYLKQAVAMDPDAAQATISLAGALTQKSPQEAIKLYKNYLIRHPGDVDIQERLAQVYQALGDVPKAKNAWEKVLDTAPSSVRGHLALAQIAEIEFDTATAISHYEDVMVQDPNNLALLLRVGELRYRNNDMANAFEAFSKAQALAPSSASVNFWLALLAENKGDWNEAIKLFKQVAEQAPDAGVLLRLAYYYSQAGRHGEAVKTLEQLSALQPDNPDFLGYLAVAYEQNNQVPKAEKTLKKLTEINPADYEARFQLATLYDRSKRFTMAEDELKKTIQGRPDFHMALNYLGYSYADRNVRLDEAEKLVMAALALDPENAAYLDSMGWVYFRQNKFDKAADFLTEATLRSQDALIWDHLGDVRQAQEKWDQAFLAWDESLRLDPDSKGVQKKIQEAQRRLSDPQKVEIYIKSAVTHFSAIKFIDGMVKVTVCQSKPCFENQATFSYVRKDSLKVEIPGPLTGPLMILTKKYGYPAKFGAIHPHLQNVESFVARAGDRLESLLSGAQFSSLKLVPFSKNAARKKGHLMSTLENVTILFDDAGKIKQVFWKDVEYSDSLKFGPYQGGAATLPTFAEWRDEQSGFMIRFDFLSPRVIQQRDIKK